MSAFYLNSYRPLAHNRLGQEACRRFGHPPFVDASCRREPDFESPFPSITAICRARNFAPRLWPGDKIIYVTNKGSITRDRRHIVAVLEVRERFETHQAASLWYSSRRLMLPSNCLVRGNPPLDVDHTDGGLPRHNDVRRWDAKYQLRVRRTGVFLVCSPLQPIELHDPTPVTDDELISVFGRVPPLRTPPPITQRQFEMLLDVLCRHRRRSGALPSGRN
jgi:hypothetical protein